MLTNRCIGLFLDLTKPPFDISEHKHVQVLG